MTDLKRDHHPLVEQFLVELHAELDQGPARVELERRRLLARLEREERTVSVRPSRRRTWGVLAAAAGCAAAAACAAVVGVIVVGMTDTAEVAMPTVVTSVSEQRDTNRFGEPIRVPDGSEARIVLQDNSTLWLGPRTEIAVQDEQRAKVRLVRGRLLARVTKKNLPESLRVFTPHATVIVHGTTFSVRAEPERTLIRLHEGKIRLAIGARTFDVRPGTEAEVTADGELATRPIDPGGALADLMVVEKATLAEPQIDPPIDRDHREDLSAGRRGRAKETLADKNRAQTNANAPRVLDDIVVQYLDELPEPPTSAGDTYRNISDNTSETNTLRVGLSEAGSALSEARFSRVRALFKARRCADTVAAAKEYLREHPGSVHAGDVLYYKTYCEAHLDRQNERRRLLESYPKTFPESRYWKRVEETLGEQ